MASLLYRRLQRFLKHNKRSVFLSFIDKDTDGTSEGGEIFLNIDLMIAHTFIHEFLHAEDPNRSERRVEKMTEEILNDLSDRECQSIGRLVLKCAKRKKYPDEN